MLTRDRERKHFEVGRGHTIVPPFLFLCSASQDLGHACMSARHVFQAVGTGI